MAIFPGEGPDRRTKFVGQRFGLVEGAVEKADLARTAVCKRQHHCASRAPGTEHGDGACVGAPVGLFVKQALDVAKPVGVHALQAHVWLHHQRIDRPYAPGVGVDLMDQLHGIDLVRNGDVAAPEAQRGKPRQGGAEAAWFNRQLHVGALEPVFFDPVVVDVR